MGARDENIPLGLLICPCCLNHIDLGDSLVLYSGPICFDCIVKGKTAIALQSLAKEFQGEEAHSS